MKKIKIMTLLLGAAAVMAGCNSGGGNKKAAVSQEDQKMLVSTYTVISEEIEQTAQFASTIKPHLQNNISGISGRISRILVNVGDRVGKGQLLVVMDQTQYTTSAVQLATLQQDYDRLKTVYDAGGVSKQQIDQLESQLKVLRESVRNLKENTELRSPISGMVTARNFDPGDQVAGMPILQVMEISSVKVTINISEQYFPQVKRGMPVDIVVDVLPDQNFQGKVSLIYPTIDPSSRTFTVEVAIPNGKQILRPGMFSRSTISFGYVDGVLVEDLAVIKQVGTNEKYVFVIDDQSVAHRRTVELGRQMGDKLVVLSGLNQGERVAVTGLTKLIEGMQVEVKNKEE